MIDLTAAEIALKEKIDSHLSSQIKQWPRSSNWASDLGFGCDTYQVLSRLKSELKSLVSLGLKKVFRASGYWETPNLILMSEAGLRIVEQKRPFQWQEKQIHGEVDAQIVVEGISEKGVKMPLEHKAVSPNVFATVLKHKIDKIPLTKSRYHFLKKYPAQLMAYDLMAGSEFGAWFFFNKVNGDFFFWINPLDLEYGEEIVQRAERTNAAVAANAIPAPVRTQLCEDCDYAETFCFVGKDFGPGADIWLDREEVNEQVKRYLELKPLAKEYEELAEDLKILVKGRHIILPDFEVDSKSYEMTSHEIPPEIWQKYQKKIIAYRMKIKPLLKG